MSSDDQAQIERWLAAIDLRRALGATAVVLFLIAWNRGIALLYGLLALVLGAVIVGFAAPRLNLRGIHARRTLGEKAVEGDGVWSEVVVTCPSRLSRYMVEITDIFPFAETAQQRPTGFVPRLRGEARLRFPVTCDLRGVHSVGPLRVASAYPLGLFTAVRELPDSTASIVVYPRPFPMERLPLLGGSRWPIGGVHAASVAGGNDQFFGVREYRHGDSPRHVHWAASARRGELVVKEYEYIHSTELMIVLDLSARALAGAGKHTTLEYQVKIAVSMAQCALAEGHGVGLYGLGAERVEIPVRRGAAHYEAILEALARVTADGETPYAQAVRQGLAQVRAGGVALLFHVPRLSNEAPPSVAELYRRHVKPLWVQFDVESFRHPDQTPVKTAARADYFVRRGDDLMRVFNA